MKGKLFYSTKFGKAYCADSINQLKKIKSNSINLVITSPPFALRRKKSYGNVSADRYYEWFLPFAKEIRRILKHSGSFVLDLGGSWNKGIPTRSLYHFDLLIRLCAVDKLFNLAQEFYWYNPAKMPAPAQWVTIERVRVKDAVNTIWWLSKSVRPKADNKKVLQPYKESMKNLLNKGYNTGLRPSGHLVSDKWSKDHGGAIASNIIIAANTKSTDDYIKACRAFKLEVHPARFVDKIPEFFIKFLTKPNDVIVDPFAGSNVVGAIAEKLRRRWVSIEVNPEYVIGSAFRFNGKGKSTCNKFKNKL